MAKIGAGGFMKMWLEKVKEGPTGRKERKKKDGLPGPLSEDGKRTLTT